MTVVLSFCDSSGPFIVSPLHSFLVIWQMKAEVGRPVCSEASYTKFPRGEVDEAGWTLKFGNDHWFELRQHWEMVDEW